MDKNAIKKFAVWARRELIERVSQKALQYGITSEGMADAGADSVNGRVLTPQEKGQRQALIAQIQEKGYEEVMEEVAYTWFNRFSALRFMEVNSYLPSYVRVFTDEENHFKPQILEEAIHLDMEGLSMEKVFAFKEANQTEELYKYLLITQCNALSEILPGMFQRISDYTELLFPDNLLREGSVIEQMITLIPEDDWRDAVQIMGWLYQYYITEQNELVYDGTLSRAKINKELIPAATTIYTPDWAVRYMVENSLGRLWIESVIRGQPLVVSGHLSEDSFQQKERERQAREKELADSMGWKYYLEEAQQEPEVQAQLDKIRREYASITPEELKVIDPCCGSGHILAYMFDVLMQIYESYGYTAREAVKSILTKNLYGLDIDDRAAQIAYFAVMMKACQYDRRFFSHTEQPHVHAIRESNHLDANVVDYFCNHDARLAKAFHTIEEELYDAKEYGSILTVTQQDWNALYHRFDEIVDDISMYKDMALKQLLPLVQTAEALAQKYNTVVTNPPYLGSSRFSEKLDSFVKSNYSDVKSDLSMVMYKHALNHMVKQHGCVAFITTSSWMFLSSFEKIRNYIFSHCSISSLVDYGTELFEGKVGHNPIVAWVTRKTQLNYTMAAVRLVDFCYARRDEKKSEFFNLNNRYEADQSNFSKIPGLPIAYWVSNAALENFISNKRICDSVQSSVGIQTGNNDKFLHYWWEISHKSICFTAQKVEDSFCEQKWFPYNKGGAYRKWYGNDEAVINWENDGQSIKQNSQITGHHYQQYDDTLKFKPLVTWSRISSGIPAFRYKNNGYLSDMAGFSFYSNDNSLKHILAFCNSSVAKYFLAFLAPTLNFMIGPVSSMPLNDTKGHSARISDETENALSISTEDWDSFETSWDFKAHPLIENASFTIAQMQEDAAKHIVDQSLIEYAYEQYQGVCEHRFKTLQRNEEELNRIFIDIYGLQDELTPEVEDSDITVYRIFDTKKDIPESMGSSKYALTKQDVIKSFISYAVGCMFGRYSLDVEGLAYAGGEISEQWVVISGQYYRKEVVEEYVRQELSGLDCLAEKHGFGDRSVPAGENAPQRGAVCTVGPDAQSSGLHSFQHCRGTSKKLYEGISALPCHSTGLESGDRNTAYDLCSPEILAAIENGSGSDLVSRGWKDADRVDWQAIHSKLITNHYSPNFDNILPICDDEYFRDDIVDHFIDFVEAVYGKETLAENLRFIADALGGKGRPKEVIRNYFLNDFFKDHCKTYQKRPIYWLFDSGKKNGFKALIYMHRYQPDTIARIRTDYVHEQQNRYRAELADVEKQLIEASSSERVKLTKLRTKLRDQDAELKVYEEKIHHLADQMISIDLDDGVKHNYEIFQDVLAKIK